MQAAIHFSMWAGGADAAASAAAGAALASRRIVPLCAVCARVPHLVAHLLEA